jgi:hypothetical protein
MSSRSATAATVALLAVGALVAAGTAVGQPGLITGQLPGPTVFLRGTGSCATDQATCTVGFSVARAPYEVVAFVHGPGPVYGTATVNGAALHLVGGCWNDTGVFGHTALYVGNVTSAVVNVELHVASPLIGVSGEYLEVALAFAGSVAISFDGWANGCALRWATGTVIGTAYPGTATGDLALYLFTMGQSNGSVGDLSCGSDAAIVATCGTPLSGIVYGVGLSWPSLAYASFVSARGGTGSIEVHGGGWGEHATPWAVAYVALTS